jgi:hypothetical protein
VRTSIALSLKGLSQKFPAIAWASLQSDYLALPDVLIAVLSDLCIARMNSPLVQ